MKKAIILLFVLVACYSYADKPNNIVYNQYVGTEEVTIKRVILDGHQCYIAVSEGYKSGGCSLVHSEAYSCKKKENIKYGKSRLYYNRAV